MRKIKLRIRIHRIHKTEANAYMHYEIMDHVDPDPKFYFVKLLMHFAT